MYQKTRNPMKLRQNRGTTIVLALLLIAICAVLGASALAAASASAATAAGRQERQAAYLSVRSSVDLLRSKVAALTFEKTVTSVVSDDAVEAKPDVVAYTDLPTDDVIGAALVTMAKKIDTGSTTATKTLTITGMDMPEVTAVLVMDSDYILHAVLTAGDKMTYTMTVTLSPEMTTAQTETEHYTAAGVPVTVAVRRTAICWSVTAMEKGAES